MLIFICTLIGVFQGWLINCILRSLRSYMPYFLDKFGASKGGLIGFGFTLAIVLSVLFVLWRLSDQISKNDLNCIFANRIGYVISIMLFYLFNHFDGTKRLKSGLNKFKDLVKSWADKVRIVIPQKQPVGV